MGAIQVKNVPEDLHEELRRRAAREGVDIRDYLLDLIRRDLALPSQREWLEQLRSQPGAGSLPPASDLLHEARAARGH